MHFSYVQVCSLYLNKGWRCPRVYKKRKSKVHKRIIEKYSGITFKSKKDYTHIPNNPIYFNMLKILKSSFFRTVSNEKPNCEKNGNIDF